MFSTHFVLPQIIVATFVVNRFDNVINFTAQRPNDGVCSDVGDFRKVLISSLHRSNVFKHCEIGPKRLRANQKETRFLCRTVQCGILRCCAVLQCNATVIAILNIRFKLDNITELQNSCRSLIFQISGQRQIKFFVADWRLEVVLR